MWVELQPFGHPGDPREHSEGHFDDNCRKYAEARNGHISERRLPFATLTSEEEMFKCFHKFFGYELGRWAAWNIRTRANDIWSKLEKNDVKALPILGQIQGDFKTFDDVLANATGTHTTVASFLFENTHSLRDKGHGRAADKYGVCGSQARVKRDIDVCEWGPAMSFSHLLLPCGIAEVSSKQDKGFTRLCLPFMQTKTGPNPEDAITSLCSLAWFLAYRLENALV